LHSLRAAFEVEPSAIVQHWFAAIGEDLPTPPEPLPAPVGIGEATATKEDLYAALAQLEAALGIETKKLS
jgi:hypothetical protein